MASVKEHQSFRLKEVGKSRSSRIRGTGGHLLGGKLKSLKVELDNKVGTWRGGTEERLITPIIGATKLHRRVILGVY